MTIELERSDEPYVLIGSVVGMIVNPCFCLRYSETLTPGCYLIWMLSHWDTSHKE
ncbi:hypothetical protein S7335_4642 [Synechococcus sp. PCC 7335]|nr:hypothetical protein S7335_4642 [Synechococcus sp. PCC 7335]